MSLPLVMVPGHMCGPWLYGPQEGVWPGETQVADVTADDSPGAMADRLLAGAPERFALMGLSLGGMVAMEAMARAPERVAAALLIATDPHAASERERAWRAAKMASVAADGPGPYVAGFVARMLGHDAGLEARLGPMVRAAMAATPVEVILAQGRALDARTDVIEAIAGFAGPVEVMVGDEDRLCPPEGHWPIAACCRDAVLDRLPGCGHLPTLEAPERVNAALARLADRLAGGTGA